MTDPDSGSRPPPPPDAGKPIPQPQMDWVMRQPGTMAPGQAPVPASEPARVQPPPGVSTAAIVLLILAVVVVFGSASFWVVYLLRS